MCKNPNAKKQTNKQHSASDWSRLSSPDNLIHFQPCVVPYWHTSTGSHRAASVHCLHGAPLLTLKPSSWFFLGAFRSNIITHESTNDVCLSAIIRCCIICMSHNAVKKCERSIFSAVFKVGVKIIGSRLFCEQSQIAFTLFQQQTELQALPETLLLSTNAERGLNLGTHHSPPLCKPHISELRKTPDPWISPCFHSNRSGATLFLCVIQSTRAFY